MLTISVQTNIAKSCSKETSRYAVRSAMPLPAPSKDDPGRGYWVATNGRILAVAPATFVGDLPAGRLPLVPVEAMTGAESVRVNGTVEAVDKKRRVVPVTPEEGTYPPVAEFLPKPDAPVVWVKLNAKLLADLAASLNEKGEYDGVVCIGVESARRPVVVLGNGNRSFGVLMPVAHEADPVKDYGELSESFKAALVAEDKRVSGK